MTRTLHTLASDLLSASALGLFLTALLTLIALVTP